MPVPDILHTAVIIISVHILAVIRFHPASHQVGHDEVIPLGKLLLRCATLRWRQLGVVADSLLQQLGDAPLVRKDGALIGKVLEDPDEGGVYPVRIPAPGVG